MSYFLRNPFAQTTPSQRDAFRKSDAGRAMTGPGPLSRGVDNTPLDSLSGSVGPDRGPVMDFRERQLAKMEATERRNQAVLKAEADHAETLGLKVTPLPSEQKRRAAANEAATGVETVFQAFNKADNAANRTPVSAPASFGLDALSKASDTLKSVTKGLSDLVAEHQALMRRINGQDDDPDDDGGAPPTGAVKDTKVKPGTSNIVHEPNPDGVYAKQDRRSVTTTHHVNRKAKGVPVAKAEHVHFCKDVAPGRLVNAAGIDLANLFTGLRLNPA